MIIPTEKRCIIIAEAGVNHNGDLAMAKELVREAAEAGATVLLAASVFHFHVIGIPELKAFLKGRGFAVRG